MFYKSRYYQQPEYKQGIRDISSVALGIGAWGLMTGVAMVDIGLSPFEAVLMSLLVFAGSAQLAATPLIVAGAPIWVVLLTAACVNLRFVVFSAHLRPYVMHLPLRERLVVGYLTGDLSYVLFVRRYHHPASTREGLEAQQAYFAASCGVNFLTWHGMSLLGILLANVIPTAWGLGFAGTLALLGVLASLVSTPLRALALAISSSAAIVAYSMPLRLNIVVAIASAVVVCLLWDKAQRRYGAERNVTGGSDA